MFAKAQKKPSTKSGKKVIVEDLGHEFSITTHCTNTSLLDIVEKIVCKAITIQNVCPCSWSNQVLPCFKKS